MLLFDNQGYTVSPRLPIDDRYYRDYNKLSTLIYFLRIDKLSVDSSRDIM